MQEINGFSEEDMAILGPLFIQSSREYLTEFRMALKNLDTPDDDDSTREILHRAVHSLKGAALQLGIVHIGQLALAVEGVAKALRYSSLPLDPDGRDLMSESADRLEAFIAGFENEDSPQDPPADLLSQLEALSSRFAAEGEQKQA